MYMLQDFFKRTSECLSKLLAEKVISEAQHETWILHLKSCCKGLKRAWRHTTDHRMSTDHEIRWEQKNNVL